MADGDGRPVGASDDEWMGLRRRRESLGRAPGGEPIEAEVIEGPATSWGADHRVRLLRTAGAEGLVPTMAVERVDGVLQAYQLPARGDRLSDLSDQTRFTRWREQAAVVEASARAVHEGHLLGLRHGALSEAEIHIAGRRLAVAGMGLTRGARLPDDAAIVAPEVRAGAAPTPRSDVYSLGKVLERGVEGDRAAVPAALAAEIATATSLDPARRHPTTLALADAIRAAGGPSLPTYELAALGTSDRGKAFAAALAGGAALAATAVADAAAASAATAAGDPSGAGSPTTSAGASTGTGDAAAAGAAAPGRRGALLAAAALVAVAGLGLWAAGRDGSGDDAGIAATSTTEITESTETSSTGVLTTVAPTTVPSSTVAPTTVPSTTVASSTVASTTVASTTVPSTTVPATTVASTTVPRPRCLDHGASTTVPSTTVASTTVAPTTVASTTVAPTTVPVPAAQAQTATEAAAGYEILHALPGPVADVYLDGELSAAGFAPGMLAGPLALTDDVAVLSLFPAVDDPPGLAAARVETPILEVPLGPVQPGTLVIAPDGDRAVAESFLDDLSTVPAGQGRLTVVPLADGIGSISVDGAPLASPPVPIVVPAGPHEIVVSGPTGAPLLAVTVDVPEGVLTTAFIRPTGGTGAPGSGDEPVALAIRRVTGLVSAPIGIPSGDAGLLARRGPDGLGPALVMMALLGAAGITIQRRRAVRPDRR